jgi:hypothetical protein
MSDLKKSSLSRSRQLICQLASLANQFAGPRSSTPSKSRKQERALFGPASPVTQRTPEPDNTLDIESSAILGSVEQDDVAEILPRIVEELRSQVEVFAEVETMYEDLLKDKDLNLVEMGQDLSKLRLEHDQMIKMNEIQESVLEKERQACK